MASLLGRIARRGRLEWRKWAWANLVAKRRGTRMLTTRQGVLTTVVGPHESIGYGLYCFGHYELDVLERAVAFLRERGLCPPRGQGTLLDVGANNGVISVGALVTGAMARAIAIEPDPSSFALLQRNVTQNGLAERFVCLPYAAASEKAQLHLGLCAENVAMHSVQVSAGRGAAPGALRFERTVVVAADCLDHMLAPLPEVFAREVALLWIDTEGYEGHAFRGARELLARGVPVVAELNPLAIRCAGMSIEEYVSIAGEYWSCFWVWRRGRFVRYPLTTLYLMFEELDGAVGDSKENVIYVP